MPSVSKKQQKFFGIVRAIQKGEMTPTTPETAKAAADMKKGDVKKFASTKHKGLPEKKKLKEFVQNISNLKESDFTNITTGNKVGQTFQHTSGATITLDGALGGKMMVPSQVTLSLPFGEGDITVDGPTESDFSLAGFTKPLDLKLQKRIEDQSVEEINDRLDASQEASGAETAKVTEMKANYEKVREGSPNLPSFDELTSDIKLPDIPKEGWTYDQYLAMIEAIKAAGATAEEPIVKEIIAYSPTGTKIFIDKHGQRNTPIGLIDAQASITAAVHKAITALDAAWEAYNKVPDLPDDYNLDDNDLLDKVAAKANVSTSKDMFDYYIDKFVDNPTNKSVNMNRIFKPHLNTLKRYLPRIEQEINLGLNRGDSLDKIQKDVNEYWNNVISPQMPLDLRNSLGNGSQVDVDKFLKTGNWQINKDFVFTEPSDFTGRDMGIFGYAPQVYARAKSIQKGTGGDLRPYVNVPMKYNITIPGSKKKKKKVNESKLSFKLIQQFREESNPRIPRKKGQPANSKKHSDLYTDENPKGTIHGLGFKNVAKAKASVSKIRNSSRSHAHKIQAAVAMEQRAREMGKTSEAAVYRKYINSMKKKTKRMNEKVEYTANEFEKLKKKIGSKKKHDIPSIEEGWSDKYKKSIDCNNPKGFSQKAHCQGRKKIKEEIQTNRKISFPEMQKRIRDAKEKRRNQRKESEKLYMDTKKKGVKFFDKKGTGRIRDGKKIYD